MSTPASSRKIVVGISGASGAIYARQLLDFLKMTPHHLSLILSSNALHISKKELGIDYRTHYPFECFNDRNFLAPFASGSARYDQMVIVPCSMGTLGRIAHGYSDSLLSRTADVFLKEKRPLILVPRETPFHLIHLENMALLARTGATILPAIPSFYGQPDSVEALAATVTARILDHLQIPNTLSPRYEENEP